MLTVGPVEATDIATAAQGRPETRELLRTTQTTACGETMSRRRSWTAGSEPNASLYWTRIGSLQQALIRLQIDYHEYYRMFQFRDWNWFGEGHLQNRPFRECRSVSRGLAHPSIKITCDSAQASQADALLVYSFGASRGAIRRCVQASSTAGENSRPSLTSGSFELDTLAEQPSPTFGYSTKNRVRRREPRLLLTPKRYTARSSPPNCLETRGFGLERKQTLNLRTAIKQPGQNVNRSVVRRLPVVDTCREITNSSPVLCPNRRARDATRRQSPPASKADSVQAKATSGRCTMGQRETWL